MIYKMDKIFDFSDEPSFALKDESKYCIFW